MAKGKRTGKGHDARYAAYKSSNTYAANRRRKLERALKRNPENEQIAIALKSIVYRRSTPTNPTWTASKRKVAQLFKLFTGKVDMNIFSNNEKVAAAALMVKGSQNRWPTPVVRAERMFSISTRVLGA